MAKRKKTKAKSKAKLRRARTKLRRAQTRARGAQARALPPQAEDDPVPNDIDEFRRALARRILTFLGMPRRCREPACRRAKRCVGPDLRCQRDNPVQKLSPDQEAAMKAALQRALRRRLAQIGQEREG